MRGTFLCFAFVSIVDKMYGDRPCKTEVGTSGWLWGPGVCVRMWKDGRR